MGRDGAEMLPVLWADRVNFADMANDSESIAFHGLSFR